MSETRYLDPEPHPFSPEWAFTTQILFNLFDIFGILMKIFCIFVIQRRCDISHAVYNLMVQYLIFGILTNLAWIIGGWFISNPLVENGYFLQWLFLQQLIGQVNNQ